MDKKNVGNLTKEIREIIPHGSIQDIAGETGHDRGTVRKVLNGEWNNPIIVQSVGRKLRSMQEKIAYLLDELGIPKDNQAA